MGIRVYNKTQHISGQFPLLAPAWNFVIKVVPPTWGPINGDMTRHFKRFPKIPRDYQRFLKRFQEISEIYRERRILMIQGSHDDSLILPWIHKQIFQTHETHIRHYHSYLTKLEEKNYKTSEDVKCSLGWFHRNLSGGGDVQVFQVLRAWRYLPRRLRTEKRWMELWFEAGPPRSPSPRQWGEANRGERLPKSWKFVKYVVYILRYWCWFFFSNKLYGDFAKTIYIKI